MPTDEHMRMALIFDLRPGAMTVFFPGNRTPDDGDPIIVARSPDGAWRVLLHLWLTESEFFVRDIAIRPWDNQSRPVGTDVLRRLPLGRWATMAHGWLAEYAQKGIDTGRGTDQLRRLARAKVTPAAGRRGFGKDFYRRLALEYLELQAEGVSRGIRVELARRESRRQDRKVTPTNIRDALNKATELGFLMPGTPGRAGRQPGPNLYSDDNKED